MTEKAKKILIIEDEKPIEQALVLKLQHEGFDVTGVSDGEEGLNLLKKNKFSLVLCDLIMPRVDGFKVLSELKDSGNTTPVIILSNLSQEEDRRKVFRLGAKEFFVKSDTPILDIVNIVKKNLA